MRRLKESDYILPKAIDLTGKRFGRLVVISKAESIHDSCGATRAMWTCQCGCGEIVTTRAETLMNGKSKSCGCLKHEIRPRNNLVGMSFGRLKVIGLAGRNDSRKLVYSCVCNCGNTIEVVGSALRNGHTKSCGCYRKDAVREQKTIHGLSQHKLRSVWRNMLARCENSKAEGYKNYGGRGISVCEEWHDLKIFSEWAFASGYHDGLTIDRKDVNGDYEPSNCCWVTMKVQCNNKRNNHYIKAYGETKTLAQWAETIGISSSLILYRLNKGLTMEQILMGER